MISILNFGGKSGQILLQQLLLDGFFHADPHPGNLYVLEDNVVCYLDFGMMGHIDHDFMQNLGNFCTGN